MTPPPAPKPPTTGEIGTQLDRYAVSLMPVSVGAQIGIGKDLGDIDEHVPDLVWPASLVQYDRMERSDGQVKALMDSICLPVGRRRFEIDPSGAADEDVRRIAEDLGLPILGSDEPDPVRGRARFNHREHLRQALLALRYGSYWFEMVGEIVDGAWRLRKLAPRPTRTLQSVRVDERGNLVGIVQRAPVNQPQGVFIPVSALVGFVWEQEGANWYGNSMLRGIWRDFYYKDVALRSDSVQKKRGSMGIPTFTPGADATDEQIQAYAQIARQLQSGMDVGVVLASADASFELKGVTGSLPNALESVRYHDESMASRFLAMWMKLGQTQTGSRALGDTLLNVFNAALDNIADDWYCGTMNEYVIRDWMAFNYGEDHDRVMPRLVSRRLEEAEAVLTDLAVAVDKGVIVADDSFRAWVRSNLNAPPANDPQADPTPPAHVGPNYTTPAVSNLPAPLQPAAPTAAPQVVAAQHSHEHVIHAGALDDGTTSRQRWRELTDREVHAGIDPHSMDQRWRDAASRIVAAWRGVQTEQVNALVDAIAAAGGDYVQLAQLTAPVAGADIIEAEMLKLAEAASKDAVREAATQGAKISGVALHGVHAMIKDRAEAAATLLAGDLARSASANAIRLTATASDPATVAEEVRPLLTGLKDGGITDGGIANRIVGALTSAQNTARTETIDQGPQPSLLVATEIMDSNTCDPCAEVDGTEYGSMDEALADYPDAGFRDCQGGDLCRGFVYADYESGDALAGAGD